MGTMPKPKKHDGGMHITVTASPMSTSASVKPLLEKESAASSWQCPANFASSLSVSREDGLCSLCVDSCVEVRRQMARISTHGPLDGHCAEVECSKIGQKDPRSV